MNLTERRIEEMKTSVFLVALLLAVPTYAQTLSQNVGVGARELGGFFEAACSLGPGSITQSDDCSIEPFTGIACSAADITTDTSYLRRFFLGPDHGVTLPYAVSSVDFGVEIDTPDPTNLITVNLYEIPIGAPFLFANLTLLASTSFDLGGGTDLTIVNAPVLGTVDPATDDLVVEVLSFDHLEAGTSGGFFPGANSLGQTRPSYIAAPDCGISEIANLADIGFPDSHNVLVVNGSAVVEIDIKPGSYPNSINCLNSKGVVTVAILGSQDFDALTVDHTTVTFEGATETHVNFKTGMPRRHERDVNDDGLIDLVFHFRLGDTALDCEATEGMLTGSTFDGQVIQGVDSVRMLERVNTQR